MKRQQDGDEGHGVGKVVKRCVEVEFSTAGDLIGGLLQRHLDVRVVDTGASQFEHGHDLVFVAWINPKEIRAHLRGGLGLGGLGFREGEELAQERGFLADAVPHRVNAFDHAGFPQQVFMSVPRFIPVVSVHLLVNEQRGELIRRCVGRFVHHLLWRVKP